MKTLKTQLAIAMMAVGLSFGAAAAEIKVAYDADPVSLDPHEQLSGGTLQLSHMVMDPLVRYTQKLEFEPRLASSWERVDETTYRFTLRKGVTFHSGNPMTADDVVWTFNRLKSSPDFKAIFEPYSELKKVDDYTVELISKYPYRWCCRLRPTSSRWTVSSTPAKPKTAKTRRSWSNTATLTRLRTFPARAHSW